MMLNYEDLLGKPFRYGGRGSDDYDCYGLAMEISRRLGKELPDFCSPTEAGLIHQVYTEGKDLFKALDKPEPYCIVAFRIHPRYTSHMGVVLEDCNRFIHILKGTSVCIERLDSLLWEKKISGFYKFEG